MRRVLVTLLDCLVDVKSGWSSRYLEDENLKSDDFRAWAISVLSGDRLEDLGYCEARQDSQTIMNEFLYSPHEPEVLLWAPGENRKESGSKISEWTEEKEVTGDHLCIYDSLRTACRVWNPDIIVTRSTTLALIGVEHCNTLVILLPDFPVKEVISLPEEFFPEMIYPVKELVELQDVITKIYRRLMA